jgi:hypothetical protein
MRATEFPEIWAQDRMLTVEDMEEMPCPVTVGSADLVATGSG